MDDWQWWAGQILMAGFDGTEPSDSIRRLIVDHHVGNVILFSRNVHDSDQLAGLTDALQELARVAGHAWPLLIATDQENGIVRRLPADLPGFPGNMALGAANDEVLTDRVGRLTARLLRMVGINMDLAPVLDVNNNPENPVIGVRSYGDQPERVARLGTAMIRGLQAGGVIACAKHFPGHGDTHVDSHRALPRIAHDRARLDQVELPPFRTAVAQGVEAVMSAHIVFSAMDEKPATLSERILTGLLRHELGFSGVIVTDCLEMDAIRDTVGVAEGAVEALKAGADMILVSHRPERQLAALEAIIKAVESGEVPEARLREAYERVETLKRRRLGDWEQYRRAAGPSRSSVVTHALHVQEDAAARGVTWLRRTDGPVPAEGIRQVALLYDERTPVNMAAGRTPAAGTLAAAVSTVWSNATVHRYGFPSVTSHGSDAWLRERIFSADLIVAGINGPPHAEYLKWLRVVWQTSVPQVTLLLGSPYDARAVAESRNLLALYENTPWMLQAALNAVTGKRADGRLPVEIPGLFPRNFSAEPAPSDR